MGIRANVALMRIPLNTALILVPLAVAPGVLFYFDVTPKVVVLLTTVAFLLLQPRVWNRGMNMPRGFALLLAAFFVSCLVSTLVSTDPALSLTGTNWRRLGLVSWTGVLLFAAGVAALARSDRREVVILMRCVTLSGAVVALYGILQWAGWDPWLPPSAYRVGDPPWTIVRPPGTLGYVTYFANYLLHLHS